MKYLFIIAMLIVTTTALAQENNFEMLRQELKTGKVALMTANLPLTEKEADLFWPLYREYDNELSKLGDRRLALIKKYAANYEKLDDEVAGQLVKESFALAGERNKLLEKYYEKVAKSVGVITAARFLQIENQMLTLVDAKLIDEIPLVKPPKAAGGEKK